MTQHKLLPSNNRLVRASLREGDKVDTSLGRAVVLSTKRSIRVRTEGGREVTMTRGQVRPLDKENWI